MTISSASKEGAIKKKNLREMKELLVLILITTAFGVIGFFSFSGHSETTQFVFEAKPPSPSSRKYQIHRDTSEESLIVEFPRKDGKIEETDYRDIMNFLGESSKGGCVAIAQLDSALSEWSDEMIVSTLLFIVRDIFHRSGLIDMPLVMDFFDEKDLPTDYIKLTPSEESIRETLISSLLSELARRDPEKACDLFKKLKLNSSFGYVGEFLLIWGKSDPVRAFKEAIDYSNQRVGMGLHPKGMDDLAKIAKSLALKKWSWIEDNLEQLNYREKESIAKGLGLIDFSKEWRSRLMTLVRIDRDQVEASDDWRKLLNYFVQSRAKNFPLKTRKWLSQDDYFESPKELYQLSVGAALPLFSGDPVAAAEWVKIKGRVAQIPPQQMLADATKAWFPYDTTTVVEHRDEIEQAFLKE